MKKILIVIVALLSVIACSKGGSGGKSDNSLVGSTFRTTGYSAVYYTIWGYYYHVYEFETSSRGYAYWADKNGNQKGNDGDFTYVLSYPNLTITRKDKTVEKFKFKDSRTFVFVLDDGSLNSSITYYKK